MSNNAMKAELKAAIEEQVRHSTEKRLYAAWQRIQAEKRMPKTWGEFAMMTIGRDDGGHKI